MKNGRRALDDRKAWLQSGLVHGAAVVVVVVSHFLQPTFPELQTVQVELVSLATETPEDPARTEELLVRTPDPEPPPPEVSEDPDPVPAPPEEPPEDPPPDSVVEEPEEEEEEPVEDPVPAPTTEPEQPEEVAEEEAADDLNVRMEGLRRDFPEYYGNIIRQVERCLRWTGTGRPEATVYFVIEREGEVADLRLMQRSGIFGFDVALLEAVERCAARNFGPLPEEMVLDRLPVALTMTPRSDETRRQRPDPRASGTDP